jgi:hypothetical protein
MESTFSALAYVQINVESSFSEFVPGLVFLLLEGLGFRV